MKKQLKPVTRDPTNGPSLDNYTEYDRTWFDAHPDENDYIREFVPGEFLAMELPAIPPGWSYATHVVVIQRNKNGAAILRGASC